MKVLYVISTFGGGGAESQLFTFCNCLKEQKECDFSVIALKTGGKIESRFNNAGIPTRVLGSKSIIKSIVLVHRILKRERFDIVHAHMFFSDIVCRLATIGTKTKLVSTHHGLGRWKKKWMVLLDKITKKRVSHFIVVSNESFSIRSKRERYPINRMSVVFNGINPNMLTNNPKRLDCNRIVLGCVARFTKNKQVKYLVEVLNELKDNPCYYVELVGEGEELENVRSLAGEYGLSERVTFHGWSDDVQSIVSNWSFFLLCSINEDLPVALLESMAKGVVPIASNVGGIPDILQNGKLGCLCNSSDYHSYTRGIKQYVGDADLYYKTSGDCIRFIKDNFLIETTVKKCFQIYHSVLGQ